MNRLKADYETVTARIRNALGGGETLEGNASLGTKTKSAYQVCHSMLVVRTLN